jgi:signal transduction histidine kinase
VRLELTAAPTVEASAIAVQRVLLNIMMNAVKYSPPGTPVAVRIDKRGRWGVIEVEDHGRGMSRIEVRRAFDRFWQADATRGGEGSGLGLSIVQDIVTTLHGDVTIMSVPRRGTTVRVRLPLSRSSHNVVRTVDTTADTV